MPSKTRFEIDPQNRLVYRTGKKSGVARYRTVLDGKFSVTPDNQLKYSAKYPCAGAQVGQGGKTTAATPTDIKLAGTWSLDKKHNLIYELDAQARDDICGKLKLKGEIISVDAYSLTFAVETKNTNGSLSLYTLTLGGKWQANERNCLVFTVESEGSRASAAGKLTFKGVWDLDKNNRLIYKLSQKGKQRCAELTFEGRWDISERNRLTYSLSKSADSGFEFDCAFSRYDQKKKALVYSLKMGAAPAKKTLTLKGTWKLKKDLGLVFEMKYAGAKGEDGGGWDGGAASIVFGAQCTVLDGTRLGFKLKNALGKDIGVTLELEREIFDGEGRAFLNAGASRGRFEITAGAGWRF